MTTDNEALKLAETRKEFEKVYGVGKYTDIRSLRLGNIYDNGMLTIAWTAWQIATGRAIQTGRDQLQKELAEVQVVGYISVITGAHGGIIKHLSKNKVRENDTPLIPQPTMPKKGERRERKMVD